MSTFSDQPGLFDAISGTDTAHAASARIRMQDMIERLRATCVPPWKDQMAVILDDGTFRRAMRLVPAEEAHLLWTAFDGQMERLYQIWLEANAPPS